MFLVVIYIMLRDLIENNEMRIPTWTNYNHVSKTHMGVQLTNIL